MNNLNGLKEYGNLRVSRDFYCYCLSPMDFGWLHLKTVKETLCDIIMHDEHGTCHKDINQTEINCFLSRWGFAKAIAKRNGWEGDFRESPRVFWIPYEDEIKYGFVYNQDNNGTLFVVSPVEIPSLSRE